MYWVEKAEPEVRARYEDLRQQWEASVKARDLIPKDEHGNFSKEEFEAGAVFDGAGVPANASDRYRAAQELQHRLYEDMHKAEIWYQRRSVWGMGMLRDVMQSLDMVRTNYSLDECPFEWPKATWDDEQWDNHFNWANGDWSTEQEAEFEQEHPDLMQAFGSNDDWIITPTECSAVLVKARRAGDDDIRMVFQAAGADWDPIGTWQSWLNFIEGAASHGGFEVR